MAAPATEIKKVICGFAETQIRPAMLLAIMVAMLEPLAKNPIAVAVSL